MMMMMVMVTTTMMTIIQASSLGPVSRVSTRFDVAPRHTCTWSRALGRGHVQTWASASRLAMTSGLAPRPNCPSSSRDCQLLAVVVLTSRLSCLALPRRVHHFVLLLLVISRARWSAVLHPPFPALAFPRGTGSSQLVTSQFHTFAPLAVAFLTLLLHERSAMRGCPDI